MADILISMNKTTDRLWKLADEWEKTPEHFDGVNPFCIAIHAVRQTTNAPDDAQETDLNRIRENIHDLINSSCSVDTDADKEYICTLIDAIFEGKPVLLDEEVEWGD